MMEPTSFFVSVTGERIVLLGYRITMVDFWRGQFFRSHFGFFNGAVIDYKRGTLALNG